MKYSSFLLLLFVLVACKKDKPTNTTNPPPTPSLLMNKPLGTDYVSALSVYPKSTSDGNMLLVLMKSGGASSLVKIDSSGTILWSTFLGNESFYKSSIKELENDQYMVYSTQTTYVISKTGSVIKQLPLVSLDGYKYGNEIYIANMGMCYKLNSNYDIIDSFSNAHKPLIIPQYYSSNVNNIPFTHYAVAFRNDNKIQYLYLDSANSPIHIITCNLDNSFVDSVSILNGYNFQTFNPSDNHLIISKGFWGGLAGPSFFAHIYKFDNLNNSIDVSNTDYSIHNFNGMMCEQDDHSILFTSLYPSFGTNFSLFKIDPTHTSISSNPIIADSIVKTEVISQNMNIAGLINQTGTTNFFLVTAGVPFSNKPQIIKINATPEVIGF